MWHLGIALLVLVVLNGLFLYWAAAEFSSVGEVLANRLAVAFILDAFLALGILAYFLAVRPRARTAGPGPWPLPRRRLRLQDPAPRLAQPPTERAAEGFRVGTRPSLISSLEASFLTSAV